MTLDSLFYVEILALKPTILLTTLETVGLKITTLQMPFITLVLTTLFKHLKPPLLQRFSDFTQTTMFIASAKVFKK